MEQRIDYVIKNNLCFNCSCPGHPSKYCKSIKCKLENCRKPQHTLLRRIKQDELTVAHFTERKHETCTKPTNESVKPTEVVNAHTASIPNAKNIILATVSILIQANNGDKITVRALLDPGAEENFVSSKLGKVWFKNKKTSSTIIWIE